MPGPIRRWRRRWLMRHAELWNLHTNRKWYRWITDRPRLPGQGIHYPGDEVTFQKIKELQEMPSKANGWERIPFPSPLDWLLEHVYPIDLDAGHVTVSLYSDSDIEEPLMFRVNLDSIREASDLSIQSLIQNADRPLQAPQYHRTASKPETEQTDTDVLQIQIGTPSPLNELQYHMFMDFTWQWQYYIDTPTTWQYPSKLFNTLAIGILRIAA